MPFCINRIDEQLRRNGDWLGNGWNRKKRGVYTTLWITLALPENLDRKSLKTPCRSVAWRAGLKTVEGTEPDMNGNALWACFTEETLDLYAFTALPTNLSQIRLRK